MVITTGAAVTTGVITGVTVGVTVVVDTTATGLDTLVVFTPLVIVTGALGVGVTTVVDVPGTVATLVTAGVTVGIIVR